MFGKAPLRRKPIDTTKGDRGSSGRSLKKLRSVSSAPHAVPALFGRVPALLHFALRSRLLLLVALLFAGGCTVIWMNHPVQIYHGAWYQVKSSFYDKSKLKQWDQWEHKFDGKIWTNDDAVKYTREMISSLNDPYTRILTPKQVEREKEESNGEYKCFGFAVEHCDNAYPRIEAVLPSSAAQKAGIERSDKLLSVNGTDLRGYSVSGVHYLMENAEELTLELSHDNTTYKRKIRRSAVKFEILTARMLRGKVGYIRLAHFLNEKSAQLVTAKVQGPLASAKSIVLDLRGNPGGNLKIAAEVCGVLMRQGRLTTLECRSSENPICHFDLDKDEIRCWQSSASMVLARPAYARTARPLVVLVDRDSASAAELVAAAVSENHVGVTMGEKTYGKGVGQTHKMLAGGYQLNVTDMKLWTPAGHWIGDGSSNRIGLMPQISLQTRNVNVAYGAVGDAQLESARAFLVRGNSKRDSSGKVLGTAHRLSTAALPSSKATNSHKRVK